MQTAPRYLRGVCSSLLLGLSIARAEPPAGYGERSPVPAGPCLNEEQRIGIQSLVAKNLRQLFAAGRLVAAEAAGGAVTLDSPIQPAPGFPDPGCYAISAFVHQTNSPGLFDFNCGSRTYAGHKGTDYFIAPFPWTMMQSGLVQVVAADAGTIVGKQDGYYDLECAHNPTSQWNGVYVQHADGSQTWYGHLKKYSLTPKGVGASVAKGEYLGCVGSSGNSDGPHLHFEVHDAQGNVVDPYAGPCSGTATGLWWRAQPPYYESSILKVATHSAAPFLPPCPDSGESPNTRDTFARGDTVYFAAYFRDILPGHSALWSVIRPDGSTRSSWTSSNDVYSAVSYRWYWFALGSSEVEDTNWQFRVTYLGTTYVHRFTVAAVNTNDTDGDGIGDNWERQYFGGLGTANSTSDWDRDRFPDLGEYAAGTEPTNPASYLGFVAASNVPAGRVVRWQSASGKRYRLENSRDLSRIGFTNLVLTNISATAPVNVVTDTAAGRGPWMYRIKLE